MDERRSVSLEYAEKYSEANIFFRAANRLRSRKKNGTLYKCLAFKFGLWREHRDAKSLQSFLYTLLCYCAGGSAVRRFLGVDPTEKVCLGGAYAPKEGQILYHWTTAERLGSVRKNGLLPVGKLDFVYMTDAPEYIAPDYFSGKVRESGTDMDFVLVGINAFALSREHELSCVLKDHEFATREVPPEFLIFE